MVHVHCTRAQEGRSWRFGNAHYASTVTLIHYSHRPAIRRVLGVQVLVPDGLSSMVQLVVTGTGVSTSSTTGDRYRFQSRLCHRKDEEQLDVAARSSSSCIRTTPQDEVILSTRAMSRQMLLCGATKNKSTKRSNPIITCFTIHPWRRTISWRP